MSDDLDRTAPTLQTIRDLVNSDSESQQIVQKFAKSLMDHVSTVIQNIDNYKDVDKKLTGIYEYRVKISAMRVYKDIEYIQTFTSIANKEGTIYDFSSTIDRVMENMSIVITMCCKLHAALGHSASDELQRQSQVLASMIPQR